MSRLAVQVSQYFKSPDHVIREVEERASLPRMTIGSICNGSHPRPDRFGQLIRAVDDETAMQWLEAYLMDDVPEEWQARVTIYIKELQASEVLKEAIAAPQLPAFDQAWLRLRAVLVKDPELGVWFCQTVAMVLGPAK